MARDSEVSKTITDEGVLVITVRGFDPVWIDPANYTDKCRNAAMLHGFAQKYIDATALGKYAQPEEKYDAMTALVNHHKNGGDLNRSRG